MNREQIKALALANGFKLKTQPDGSEDLNPYVYEFAEALVDTLLPKAGPGCFEVPRMSDLFALPVEKWQYSKLLRDKSGEVINQNTEQIAATAYAINNHDSMRAASLMSARDLVVLNEKAEQLKAEVERLQVAHDDLQIENTRLEQTYGDDYVAIEQERDQLKAKLSREEDQHMNTVDQRDMTEQFADRLASGIAEALGIEIGEHSSANNPWAEAITAIEEFDLAAHDAEVIERAIPGFLDPTTNNGDFRRDSEFRMGWNKCRDDLAHQVKQLRQQAKEVQS